jgi:hypothetical protein
VAKASHLQFDAGITIEQVRALVEETQMGLVQCKNILMRRAIYKAIAEAESFEDAKPAILALIGQFPE